MIGVDLFKLRFGGTAYIFFKAECWGTGLQQVERVASKCSKDVLYTFMQSWAKRYGWPEMVVADQGGEFTGSEFQD